jgi:hypothetical protein
VSIASEYDHAEQVVADVALLQDMAEGRLDDERVKQAAQVLLEHKRHELPSVSVAVAARLLGVSRPTVESWRQAAFSPQFQSGAGVTRSASKASCACRLCSKNSGG